jgi:hypothetical protein
MATPVMPGFPEQHTIEVFLRDGSHLIVALSGGDPWDTGLDAQVVDAVLRAGDVEAEMLEGLRACAVACGLSFEASQARDPRTVLLACPSSDA